MAEKTVTSNLTALEAVRRTSQPWPNRIIECIAQTNELLLDPPVIECNNGTEHTIVQRASLAGATLRRYYEGTKPITTQTITVNEPTAMWQGITEVDVDLADHTGDPAGLRKSDAVGVLNGMGIDQARDIIYGSRGENKKGINGLAVRLNKVDEKNVFDAGGTGSSLTSLYLAATGSFITSTRKDSGPSAPSTKTWTRF
jgi:hypothetical protein